MQETLNQSAHQAQLVLTGLQYRQWRNHLFSDNWWMLLGTLLIPWIVWWLVVKKEMLFQVLSYALFIVIIGCTLDVYGIKLGWWAYSTKLFYLNPGLIAGDWGLPPAVKSLIYQYFPDWPRYIAAQIILAALFSFVGEPAMHARGVYLLYNWSYLNSFLVYLPVAFLSKLIVDGLQKHVQV